MVEKKKKTRFSKTLSLLLAVTLAMSTMLGVLPITAQADEICTHIHDATCGYFEDSVCTHVHDDACGGSAEGQLPPTTATDDEAVTQTGDTTSLPPAPAEEDTLLPMSTSYTVTFKAEGSEDTTQEVAQGELATEPATTPAIPTGKVSFLGWFIDSGCTIEFDFTTAITAPLTLYAGFSEQYLVSFKNADGTVYESQLVTSGTTAAWPSQNPSSPSGSFMYWYVEGDVDEAHFDFFGTQITANLTLCPKFVNTHYVLFNSQGSAVAPVTVENGGLLAEPEAPTRDGYTFAFWSTDSAATYTETAKAYDFTLPVTANLTLTSIWEPKNTVEYTIAFWMENANYSGTPDYANPSDYAYVHFITRTDGVAGTETTLTGTESFISSLFTTGTHNMLKYADFQYVENRVINGDGSTVINVYATRKVYTYTYSLGNTNDWNTPERFMTIKSSGIEYTNNGGTPRFSIQVKYGQDVTDLLPWVGDINATFRSHRSLGISYTFVGWETDSNMSVSPATLVSRRNTIDASMLSADGQVLNYTLTADWRNIDIDKRYLYMVEPLEGTSGNTNPNNGAVWIDGYVELDEYRQSLGGDLWDWVFGNTLGAKDIYGYTRVSVNPADRWYRDGQWYDNNPQNWPWQPRAERYYVFFYERDAHDFIFDLQTPTGASIDNQPSPLSSEVPFGASLADYEPTSDPACEGYTFGGWYTSTDYIEEFDFAATMPDNEVKVFARWIPDTITATYYSKPGGVQVDEQSYPKGSTLNPSTEYEVGELYPNLGEFRGWGWLLPDSDVLRPLDSGYTINAPLGLYGMWKTDDFTLAYDENGGRGILPADDARYKLNALAPVSTEGDLARDSDEVFVGWQVAGEGPVYYPGSHVVIQGDTVLVALYVATDTSLPKLTYHANYGDQPATIEQTVVSGEAFMSLGNDAFTRSGYVLTGWSDTLGGTEVVYDFGETITITQDTTLYAVWEKTEAFVVEFKVQEGQETWGTLAGAPLVYEDVANGTEFWSLVDTFPAATANAGYRFVGWEPNTPPNMYVNDNWTFTAIFVPLVTITFVAGDNVSFGASDQTAFTVDAGSVWQDVIIVPTPTADEYYTLDDDWTDPLPGNDAEITANATYTMNATRDQVTVNFTPVGSGFAFGTAYHYSVDAGSTWGEAIASGALSVPVPPLWPSYRLGEWDPVIPNDDFVITEEMDFEITAVRLDIVITTGGAVRDYDGTALTAGYSVSDLPEGLELTAMLDGEQTNVGSSENTVESYTITLQNEDGTELDVTDYFDASYGNGSAVRVVPGTLTVNPRPVTIVVDSFTKTVGTADPEFTAQVTNLVEGEEIGYELEREPGEDVGVYVIYPIMLGVDNYSISSEDGALTIEAVPVVPVVPVVPAADPAAGPAAPETVIPDEETPLAETVIGDEETPLAQASQSGWALVNLLLTLLTAALMLILIVGYFTSKNKNEYQGVHVMGQTSASAAVQSSTLATTIRFLSLVPAVVAVVVFMLTQNMSLPMQMFDSWTILMAIIAVVQIVLVCVAAASRNKPDGGGTHQAWS